jgi:predicted amino acid dehydrogenase
VALRVAVATGILETATADSGGIFTCLAGRKPDVHRFAFIIHPLDIRDVARKYPIARWLPGPVVEAALRFIPPKVVSHITGIVSPTGATTEGWFIGCPLTSTQLKNGDVRKNTDAIVECGKIAEDLGAEIVGLGAFTSIVGDAGITVAERLEIGVTTGNSYTVATALEGALKAAELLGHDPSRCTLAILGATGSIGRVAAKILAPQVACVVLHARSEGPLRELAAELAPATVRVCTDTASALAEADIVIAVTSAVEAVVEPEMLKPGAVVCDVARPRDVSRRVAEVRPDVLVIEGGAVAVPGDVDFHFNFGFPPKEAYACMAETMILALEGRCGDYSLGRDIKIEQVHEIADLARKHGFKLAGFRSFERRVSEEQIARVRQYVTQNR